MELNDYIREQLNTTGVNTDTTETTTELDNEHTTTNLPSDSQSPDPSDPKSGTADESEPSSDATDEQPQRNNSAASEPNETTGDDGGADGSPDTNEIDEDGNDDDASSQDGSQEDPQASSEEGSEEGSEEDTSQESRGEEGGEIDTPEQAAQVLDAIADNNQPDNDDDDDDDGLGTIDPELPESGSGDGQGEDGDEDFTTDADTGSDNDPVEQAVEESEQPLEDEDGENAVDKAQTTISEAKKISENLARLARMITDLFPEGNESARSRPGYAQAMRLATLGLESLQQRTNTVLGTNSPISEDDPLVLAAVQTNTQVHHAFHELVERIDVPELKDTLATLKGTEAVNPGQLVSANSIVRAIGINGSVNVSQLTASFFYGRLEQSLRLWLRTDFTRFLKELVDEGTGVFPSDPALVDLRVYDDAVTNQIVERYQVRPAPHSALLPGGWSLAILDKDEQTKTQFIRVVPAVDGELTVPTNADRELLIKELASMIQVVDGLQTSCGFVVKVTGALKDWLDDVTPEEVDELQLVRLYATLALLEQTTQRCVSYLLGLVELLRL